ncbi:MAG: protein kinase [Polyangia bacterium]
MLQRVPPVIANRYRIIHEIGRGGMGAVFLAKHLNTGDYLALKLLHENALVHKDAVERFKREMRLPAKIRSEHVVKITDADAAPELDGGPFLVMELLTGCDLCRVLQKKGRRSAEETVWIFSQISKALDKAHALGIVHRDLKPENLFLHRREDDSLMVKILDFGIAKLTEDIRRTSIKDKDAATAKLTSSVGTPLYMSPEQAQGQSPGAPPIGPAADIWAIGMMAFELLTGETYLRGSSPMELIEQLLFSPIEAPSKRAGTLPAAFDAWFLRSCDRDPARRFTSVSEQVAALGAVLAVPHGAGAAPQSLVTVVAQLAPPPISSVNLGQLGSVSVGRSATSGGAAYAATEPDTAAAPGRSDSSDKRARGPAPGQEPSQAQVRSGPADAARAQVAADHSLRAEPKEPLAPRPAGRPTRWILIGLVVVLLLALALVASRALGAGAPRATAAGARGAALVVARAAGNVR